MRSLGKRGSRRRCATSHEVVVKDALCEESYGDGSGIEDVFIPFESSTDDKRRIGQMPSRLISIHIVRNYRE